MISTLGVNIDHIATIREARKGIEPEVVHAALIAEQAGAFGITVHLRKDRRHIQDRDIKLLKDVVSTKLNLEMSIDEEIVNIALETNPEQVTLVPENREEVTTEGGLDMAANIDKVTDVVKRLQEQGMVVSLFIDPDFKQIEFSKQSGAQYIEIHTGTYANAKGQAQIDEFNKIVKAVKYAKELNLGVNAGHGLNYLNTLPIASIPEVEELNIGHSIISRAVFTGLEKSITDMLAIINNAKDSYKWPY